MDSALFSSLAGAVTVLVTAVIALWLARKAGLTDLQRAVENESSVLIARLKERVTQLEADLATEKAETARLRSSNLTLSQRVDDLEEKLADFVLQSKLALRGPRGEQGPRGAPGPTGPRSEP